uniref:(northern house mosquito) hypothetical protein n=1 Tax=Culex pipiens TaxID=7175 RepID=A0A8D8CG36_CULPI
MKHVSPPLILCSFSCVVVAALAAAVACGSSCRFRVSLRDNLVSLIAIERKVGIVAGAIISCGRRQVFPRVVIVAVRVLVEQVPGDRNSLATRREERVRVLGQVVQHVCLLAPGRVEQLLGRAVVLPADVLDGG